MKRSAIQHGAYLRMAPKTAATRAPVMRKCKVCRQPFQVFRALQKICDGHVCATAMVERAQQKAARVAARAERAKLKERKEAAKPRSHWLKEAQTAFNAWIRARDAALPCVSCGRHHEGQWHAGHYLSTGARPELRFEPLNVHKQCQPCNTHLSGNLVLYRAELIRRIGLERVEWLEGPHQPAKLTIEQLKEIRDSNRAKVRAIKANP